MKKIFLFVAAMVFAFAANATAVVLPNTLDATNVGFHDLPFVDVEDGDYVGTYFNTCPNGSSNDTLLYAEWDVTIQPMKYNLAVDVYNTNSWRVQLYLLNQAGDTLKSLRYKGSSGEKGKFTIGTLDLRDLEAGDYKLRIRSAYAWSALKFKSVIVEANYSGANVALPGTLLPAYAELSSGASVKNNAIAFKESTADQEYATWNVSFADAGKYYVSIDVTGTNCHNYSVALVTAEGEIAVSEGSCHEDSGDRVLGSITVPAAGNYVVKLTNATVWSNAVLNNITFARPAVAIAGSMNSWSENANVMTPAEDGKSASVTITLDDWYYEFKVVNDGAWLSLGDDPANLYTIHRGWNKVSGLATDKQNFKLTPDVVPGEYTFKWTYATGELEVIFPVKLPSVAIGGEMNEWSASANVLTPAEDKLTASTTIALDAKNYAFKMVVDGHWLALDADHNVTRENNTIADVNQEISMGPNLILNADVAGNYTFTWTYATNSLEITFPAAPVLENGYYLVGDFGGVPAWGVESLTAAKKFHQNPDNAEEQMLENVTLATDDSLKVVLVENDVIQWYSPEASNYVVDANHAGVKTIYFRPNGGGGEAWFYNVIFIEGNGSGTAVDNTVVKSEAIKRIENGMIIIEKNGVRYTVLGTQMK